MILLVGATGRLGRAVAERLLREGVPFRAASRTPGKADWLKGEAVEVLHLDLASPDGIAAAMSGVKTVFTAIHGLLGRSAASIDRVDRIAHRELIDVAARAGVKRFVYTSALSLA